MKKWALEYQAGPAGSSRLHCATRTVIYPWVVAAVVADAQFTRLRALWLPRNRPALLVEHRRCVALQTGSRQLRNPTSPAAAVDQTAVSPACQPVHRSIAAPARRGRRRFRPAHARQFGS